MPDQNTQAGFSLPDLGEGLSEAEIISWHIAVGDQVAVDQLLVTVETDKALVEIPSPRAGRIQALCAETGSQVKVGDLLVMYEGEKPRSEIASGAIVGELPRAPEPLFSKHEAKREDSSVRASPRARQRARELGVDLHAVAASGPKGTISVEDVEKVVPATTSGRLKGIRRAMARRMADAHRKVARSTVTGEAQVTGWSFQKHYMLRLIRAVGSACLAQPQLNAQFDETALALNLQPVVNLGIAMEAPDGLFVPVLRDVNASSPEQLAAELERLRIAVTKRTISADELRGQTITLSNFGAVAGLHAEMIVVPPQVAIVGAGRIFERVGLDGAHTLLQRFLPISITFDHRVITGAETCEFLLSLTSDLERMN